MEVTFLGTGTSAGIPMIGCTCEVCTSSDPKDNRTRTSIYLEVDGVKIVVDTGPDFRHQLLREGIDDIDAILYTHSHKDHIAGLDDIRPINYLKQKEIEAFANRQTLERLQQEFPYVFARDYPGVPLVQFHEIVADNFQVKGVEVLKIEALHGKMPVLGFRIQDFTYLTDVNSIEDRELEKVQGSKVFVLDALHFRQHYSHYTIDEAIEIAQRVGAEQTYFIHMSHWAGTHQKLSDKLPKGIHLSYDGLKLTL